MPYHDPERNWDPNNQHDFDLFAQIAFFAEEQHSKTTGAHQHAADRRGDAEANQNRDENEATIQSSRKKRWVPGRVRMITSTGSPSAAKARHYFRHPRT